VCELAWRGDPRVRARTQSSIALTADGDSWLLVNASPDLPHQIRSTPALWPRRPPRHSPITAVVLTNADIDHVAGLLSLRERQPFRLIATGAVHAAIAANPIFDVLDARLVERAEARPGEAIAAAGLSLALVPVPGKAPLYLEGENPEIGATGGETAALTARLGHARLAYVPGCAALTPAVLEILHHADVVLFDATLFADDEMIAAGLGEKTGLRMGHVPIGGPGGSLQALASLPARRKIYIHINNTNPILVEGSPERRQVEAAGVEVAHDGMEIDL
jgi:pyrroloquinoline quinone biosynthesis protein B